MRSAARRRPVVWTEDDLVAGALCLDFLNTAYGRWEGGLAERLFTYDDLLRWAVFAGALDAGAARALAAEARRRPAAGRRALQRGLGLREAAHRVLGCFLAKTAPAPADVALVERWIASAQANAELVVDVSGARWRWRTRSLGLERTLWPIARSIANLLDKGELPRLSCCAAPGCAWFFIDRSKNRARRWCSMQTCGNRAKVARHYRRGREADDTGGPARLSKKRARR